jgi:hypothetical protein
MYDRTKIKAQSAAADLLIRAGYDATFEDDHSGMRVSIRRPGERIYLFLDGHWDANGEAKTGSLLGQELQFGRIDDGDLEDIRPISTTTTDPIDWTDPADIAAAILAAIDMHEGA